MPRTCSLLTWLPFHVTVICLTLSHMTKCVAVCVWFNCECCEDACSLGSEQHSGASLQLFFFFFFFFFELSLPAWFGKGNHGPVWEGRSSDVVIVGICWWGGCSCWYPNQSVPDPSDAHHTWSAIVVAADQRTVQQEHASDQVLYFVAGRSSAEHPFFFGLILRRLGVSSAGPI